MVMHRFVFACLKLIANVRVFEVLRFEGYFAGKVVLAYEPMKRA
jgi:hypothetical protein